MQDCSVRIRRRRDGLVVAHIPSLAKAVGYGLDHEEALLELCKSLRRLFGKSLAGTETGASRTAGPMLASD